jgi:intracellular multiplication protein IcmB
MSIAFSVFSIICLIAVVFFVSSLWRGDISFGDRFFAGIDNFLHGLNDWFGKSAGHMCRLETSCHENLLVSDDGSYVSVTELAGSLTIVGDEEFDRIMTHMNDLLASRLAKPGYAVQILFQYDPDEAAYEISELMLPSRNTAKLLGMDLDDMMNDWEASIAQWCAAEHVYIVVWTRPEIMAPVQRKNAKKAEGEAIAKAPNARGCQVVSRGVRQIMDEHLAAVDGLISGMASADLLARILTAHEALWCMRRAIDKPYTGRGWRALLPGDPLPNVMPDPGEQDLSGILYPNIGSQLYPRRISNFTDNILRIGNDTWHGSLVMTRPPQNIQPFNALYKSMLGAGIPYRVSFLMCGDGLNGTLFKQTVAMLLHFASTNNKMFNNAIEALKRKQMQGSAVTSFQCTMGTSLYGENSEAKAAQEISERLSILATNAQSWGAADIRDVVGDPVLGLNATIPGIMPTSTAPKAVAPLDEAILMTPITRPASLWKHGNLLYRTSDGKIMPYQMGSSLQAAWVDIGVSPMGGGKSVQLNPLNYSFITQSGVTRLPWLSVLDVGPSSSGLVELIKASLPDHKKYLAQYHRLRMESRYAINPFDLPLGMDKPTPAHKSFLVNLLSLFGTEIGADAPLDGISAIARACIDATYEEYSQKRTPKPYVRNIDSEVDALVDALGIHLDVKTSWWEIRDCLFDAGYVHESTRAQRFAVPLLAEVAAMSNRDLVTGIYTHHTPNGELITRFFWRQCVDAIQAYPILKEPTQFDIGDAQVVCLDLDEVAPRGGAEADRQTGVMYMLGRHVVASRFFLMPEDVHIAADRYKKWHEERIANIRQDPKRLCYDEMHRVIRSASIAKQVVGDIETISRESRKWNLSLGVYSQSIDDFPDIIVELATTLYILGIGTTQMARRITERFGLNETAFVEMQKLGKPDKRGANFLGIFKAGNSVSVHRLTNTIGMQALWAFSSTTEDTTVRNELYKRLGVSETLRRLAKLYPGGIKDEADKRKLKFAGVNDDALSVDINKQLINEIAATTL